MSVRVYEPPVDPSSVPIETVAGAAGARRQVMEVGSPLPAGGNTIGTVLETSLLNRKVAEGKVFFTGKAISAGGTLSSGRACFMVENPALLPDGVTANTKTLYLFTLSVYSDVTQQIVYRDGAALNNPTWLTPRAWNRRLAAANQHPASVARVAWSNTSTSGGTPLTNESRVFNTSPLGLNFPAPYEIPPGTSFTLDFQSTASQTTTANGYWYKE